MPDMKPGIQRRAYSALNSTQIRGLGWCFNGVMIASKWLSRRCAQKRGQNTWDAARPAVAIGRDFTPRPPGFFRWTTSPHHLEVVEHFLRLKYLSRRSRSRRPSSQCSTWEPHREIGLGRGHAACQPTPSAGEPLLAPSLSCPRSPAAHRRVRARRAGHQVRRVEDLALPVGGNGDAAHPARCSSGASAPAWSARRARAPERAQVIARAARPRCIHAQSPHLLREAAPAAGA